MKKSFLAVLIALCIAALPCGNAFLADAASSKQSSDKVDEFIQKGFEFKLGHTKSRIIKNLGEPVSLRHERVKPANPYMANPSDEINDEYYELVYDGLSVVLYLAAAEHQELLQRVTITDPKFALKGGLKVGSTRADVVNWLGAPSEEQAGCLIYRNRAGTEDSVSFFLDNDAVKKIDWSYSVIE